MPSLTQTVKDHAKSLGFDAVGIVAFPPVERESFTNTSPSTSSHTPSTLTDHLRTRLEEWLARGYHATMHWMAKDSGRRSNPSHVLPGCRSLIVVGMNYYTGHDADESEQAGRIARYAWGKDYHLILQERLHLLEEFLHTTIPHIQTRSYVDTGPVMEKPWAQQAGLGWIGKHTNLVSTEWGSWLVLGEVLTTESFAPDEPAADLCGSCTLCIQACPTGAIVEPYILDAERCISYLTIEYRGDDTDLPPERHKQVGNRIFGCDDCIDICPFNVNAQPTNEEGFAPTPWTLHPKLSDLMHVSKEEFLRKTKGSPIRRSKFEGFQRNLRRSLKNFSKLSSSTATP